jgi:flagellar FliJ protein
MRRFQFRLESVLRYREMKEERIQTRWARAVQAVHRTRGQIDQLEEERRGVQEEIRKLLTAGGSLRGVMDLRSYWLILDRQRLLAQKELERLEGLEERVRAESVRASRERQVLESLKERRRQEHRQQTDKEERSFLDEVSTSLVCRRMHESGSVLTYLNLFSSVTLVTLGVLALGLWAGGYVDTAKLEKIASVLREEAPAAPGSKEEAQPSEADQVAREAALFQEMEGVRARLEKERQQVHQQIALEQSHLEEMRRSLEGDRQKLEQQRQNLERAEERPRALADQDRGGDRRKALKERMTAMKPQDLRRLIEDYEDQEIADLLMELEPRVCAKVLRDLLDDPEPRFQEKARSVFDRMRRLQPDPLLAKSAVK